MAQHRATLTRPSTPATHRRTHRVRWTLMCVGAFLACMWAIGHAQQEQAQATVPAPTQCTPYEMALGNAAFEQGNYVRLDCVDDGHITLHVCTSEDGSAPGQEFPCLWDAQAQGNGQGTSYVLTVDHAVTLAEAELLSK